MITRRNPILQEVKRAYFAGINRHPDDTPTAWVSLEYTPGNPWSLVLGPVAATTEAEEQFAVRVLNRLAGVVSETVLSDAAIDQLIENVRHHRGDYVAQVEELAALYRGERDRL